MFLFIVCSFWFLGIDFLSVLLVVCSFLRALGLCSFAFVLLCVFACFCCLRLLAIVRDVLCLFMSVCVVLAFLFLFC